MKHIVRQSLLIILIALTIFTLSSDSMSGSVKCNISFWINFVDFSCLDSSANVTYTNMNYNNECTLFEKSGDWSTYKLQVNLTSKTVLNFTAFDTKYCLRENEFLFIEKSSKLTQCTPVKLITVQGNVTAGSIIVNCSN
ncbi:unnamed protein product [Didymodactylos carnosus]|uniref:Transmembrane protein n=1 Tax=Didymodactylos carnosus TaxID=1234261 RepID=A0A815QQ87_9BILA|nr:unnamed protein product [Didymodactylos carnosus]CAF1466272.1 unnamed protein product [Didymodactylos carnosus]CAF3775724.1 unnamed protein product [Didymodactylos carnosus]CAF4335308.1 unnamed protein product [Didymodactylos carnosus]